MEHVIVNAQTKDVQHLAFTAEEEAAFLLASLPKQSDYSNAIQALVDQTAQSRSYADGVALASYVQSTNPSWAQEAIAFIAWRDAVWSYAYTQLAAVQAAQRSQPSVDQLLSELPTISWT